MAGAASGSGVPDVATGSSGWAGSGSDDRSAGFEDGVEGLAAAHHEVQVRFGEVAEAAVEDDRQRDVVQGGVVGGRVAGADAAGVLAHGGVAAPFSTCSGRGSRRAGVRGRRVRRYRTEVMP